jgi:hypothetical protein
MKTPLAVLLLLGGLVLGSPASATPGVNMSWDACTPGGGVQAKTFACDTNDVSNVMYGTFILAANQPNFTGAEITIDLQAQSDSLPSWWRFDAGSCRESGLYVSFTFSSDSKTYCKDPWGGHGVGGIAGYQTYWTAHESDIGANRARLKMGAAVPSSSPRSLTAGTEYYCFKLVLTSDNTVGTGSCGGCATPVCIVLSKISAVQSDGTQEDLTSAITSNILSWQSGGTCSGANIPQNLTWGQVRSVMR